MDLEIITNSRMKAFNACRRLHHYKYDLGYRAVIDREAMDFGTIFHAGLEAWWLAYAGARPLMALAEAKAAIDKAGQGVATFDDAAAAKAELLMLGYHARWAPCMDEYEVIGAEMRFEAPMPIPDGAKRVRGLRVAGKLDVLVRRIDNGTVWLVEHKTTTADLSPGSTYWQRLRMDTQVSVYFEGARTLGYEITGCLYDVISRPQQRPLKATPMEKRKRKKDGSYYANVREHDESLEAFKARMATEIAEAPDAFFNRQEVVRLEAEIEESRRDTYDTALMIRDAKNTERAPRNPDACHLFGRVCEYYDVCCQTASLDDESRFKKLDSVHPELNTAA